METAGGEFRVYCAFNVRYIVIVTDNPAKWTNQTPRLTNIEPDAFFRMIAVNIDGVEGCRLEQRQNMLTRAADGMYSLGCARNLDIMEENTECS